MSIIRITRIILAVVIGGFLLTGCISNESSTEKLYQVLENVVDAEKEFEEQQEPLVELERQEKEIYNEIMTLVMKQHEKIVTLSDEALSIIEKRKNHLQLEIDSINASETEFKKAEEIISNIKNSEQKNKAEDLSKIMKKRYQLHNRLSKEYSSALDRDKELYLMLKEESISYDKLEAHVADLNSTYQKVLDANEEFNDLTAQYNEKKLKLYKEAGLNLNDEK
ncbi:YkyA family protein [Neobacillus sp. YX16]|uniref:YkyA family protein n=1 Tax=Neobacillus sp. YX16 TaxID=3047874 RepID=UPI0024C3970F|nr:YkyA family protein [Neobacillus sp. YX16]WHZ04691.1 YkyA family protein [Neobacillus sp. YX16]